jgi:hypothetical protein
MISGVYRTEVIVWYGWNEKSRALSVFGCALDRLESKVVVA